MQNTKAIRECIKFLEDAEDGLVENEEVRE
jgi:hypothetical protein